MNITNVVLTTIDMCTVIGGIIGNLYIVILIAQKKKMQHTTNYLVINLALANLAISSIVIPLTMANRISYWIPNEFECIIVMPTIEHFAGVCVLTHTAISIARHMIISQIKLSLKIRPRHVTLVNILIWIVAFVIMSVSLMGVFGKFVYVRSHSKYANGTMETKPQYHNRNQTLFINVQMENFTCKLQYNNESCKKLYALVVFLITYIIPMVCTGISYFRIHRVVSKNTCNLKGHMSKDLLVSRKRSSRRLDHALLTMYLFFGITTLPIQALYLVTGLIESGHIDIPTFIWPVCLTLFYLQVLANPLVLFCMGVDYRKELCKLSVCIFHPRQFCSASLRLKEIK